VPPHFLLGANLSQLSSATYNKLIIWQIKEIINCYLSVQKDYVFVKNVLHVSAYTVIIRYSFIKVLKQNSAHNVKPFYIKNWDLSILKCRIFRHQILMLTLICINKMLYASQFTRPCYMSCPSYI
jgi:hypothetical protein